MLSIELWKDIYYYIKELRNLFECHISWDNMVGEHFQRAILLAKIYHHSCYLLGEFGLRSLLLVPSPWKRTSAKANTIQIKFHRTYTNSVIRTMSDKSSNNDNNSRSTPPTTLLISKPIIQPYINVQYLWRNELIYGKIVVRSTASLRVPSTAIHPKPSPRHSNSRWMLQMLSMRMVPPMVSTIHISTPA